MSSKYQVSLTFSGATEGVGELTWGQRFVWGILQSLAPANHYVNLFFPTELDGNTSVGRVISALQTLVCRHESLRTRYRVGADGEPLQQVHGNGTLSLDVCEAEPGHERDLVEQEADMLWRMPFDDEGEWPLRVCVITVDGRPRHVVFVISHLAMDGWGFQVFHDEFRALLALAGSDNAATSAAPAWQPRARAKFESTPMGRRCSERSLGYWRTTLQAAPQTAFPALPEAGETPQFPGFVIDSTALAAAAHMVAARHQVSAATVVLAAAATIIGVRSGTDAVPLMLAASNRLSEEDRVSVGTAYHVAPVVLRIDAGSLAETIRQTHRSSMLAYARAQCDSRDAGRLLDSVNHDRGVAIELSTTVNIVPATSPPALPADGFGRAELARMAEATRVLPREGRENENIKVYLHVQDLSSQAVVELFCDSRYLSSGYAHKVLVGLERTLVEMAVAGDVDVSRITELTGVVPLKRSDDFIFVDNCWIDLAKVQELVLGLPDHVASNVFLVTSADGRTELAAFVVTRQPATPQTLHADLMTRLTLGVTMTPHRYVICQAAPDRPDDRAAWERQRVLAEGTGRVDSDD
jgi:hypothetical protein